MTKPKGPISDKSTVLGASDADTNPGTKKPQGAISDKSTVMGAGSGEGGRIPDTLTATGPSGPSGGGGGFPWKAGDKVGTGDRWVLLEPLGRGGSGTVWLARDLQYGKERALKFVDLTDPGHAAQFDNEAHLAQDVSSKHVARSFEPDRVTDGTGTRWGILPQEYIKGTTLDWVIKQLEPHGGITPDEQRRILRTALMGLDAVHEANLIHRDIKPENLMVRGWDPNRRNVDDVVVIDLGTCVRAGGGPGQMQYPIVGTPGYWAPELQGSAQFANRSTDLYSLGVVAMVATTHGVDPRTWTKPLTDHGDLLNRLDADLKTSILKAVEYSSAPGMRWANAPEWLDALKQKVAPPPPPKTTAPAPTPAPAPAKPTPAPAASGGRPPVASALLGFVMLAICGVGIVGVVGVLLKDDPKVVDPPPVTAEETTPVDELGELGKQMEEGKAEPETSTEEKGRKPRTPSSKAESRSGPVTPEPTTPSVMDSLAARVQDPATPATVADPTPAPVTRSGFSLDIRGTDGGLAYCVQSGLKSRGLKSASPSKAAHRIVVTVSAKESPNSNPSMPSAYGTARATVNGASAPLPPSGAKWTAFGGSPEAALANAFALEHLKGSTSMDTVCAAMVGALAEAVQ